MDTEAAGFAAFCKSFGVATESSNSSKGKQRAKSKNKRDKGDRSKSVADATSKEESSSSAATADAPARGADAGKNRKEKNRRRQCRQNEEDREFLNAECCRRYLRARDFNVEKASAMLQSTLDWRREFRPFAITLEEIRGVLAVGGMYLSSAHDRHGRPIVMIRPGEHNPFSAEERVRFLTYVMERATARADAAKAAGVGDGKLTWIADFSSYGQRAKSPDGRTVAQNSVHILQNHYPERLGNMFIVSAPWFFRLLGTFLSPFLEAETKKKIHWLSGSAEQIFERLVVDIAPEHIEKRYGGELAWELDAGRDDPFADIPVPDNERFFV